MKHQSEPVSQKACNYCLLFLSILFQTYYLESDAVAPLVRYPFILHFRLQRLVSAVTNQIHDLDQPKIAKTLYRIQSYPEKRYFLSLLL